MKNVIELKVEDLVLPNQLYLYQKSCSSYYCLYYTGWWVKRRKYHPQCL